MQICPCHYRPKYSNLKIHQKHKYQNSVKPVTYFEWVPTVINFKDQTYKMTLKMLKMSKTLFGQLCAYLMRWYPSSNLCKIFNQKIFQLSFKKIWKIFLELSHAQSGSYRCLQRICSLMWWSKLHRMYGRRDRRRQQQHPFGLGSLGKNVK